MECGEIIYVDTNIEIDSGRIERLSYVSKMVVLTVQKTKLSKVTWGYGSLAHLIGTVVCY